MENGAREAALRLVRERGTIALNGDINPDVADVVKACVLEAMFRGIKKLTVLIDSPGGNTGAGVSIANTIALASANGIEVEGVVLGKASSAAFRVLQSCKPRLAFEGATLVVHWGQMCLSNADLHAIVCGDPTLVISQIKSSREEMVEVYAKRSGLDPSRIRSLCEQELPMTGSMALEFGFLDLLADARNYKFPQPATGSS